MKPMRLAAVALVLVALALPMAAWGSSTPSQAPAQLAISSIPPTLPVGSSNIPAVVISLLDAAGHPTMMLSDLTVYLSSSNASTVSIPSSVVLPAGHSFVEVDVNTGPDAGSVALAAACTGMSTGFFTVRTVQPSAGAVGLSLYVSPTSAMQAVVGDDVAYAVQLTASKGGPATSPSDTSLLLTSSNSTLMGAPLKVVIPAGATATYGQLEVNGSGKTTLTAVSNQLATGSAAVNVIASAPSLTLSATPQVLNGTGSSAVKASLSFLGVPLQGVNVTFSTPGGTMVPATVATDSAGQGSSIFVAGPPGTAVVSASADIPLLGVLTKSTVVTVLAPSSPIVQAKSFLSAYVDLIPVVVIVVVAVSGYLYVRRALRKRATVVDEDEFPGPAKA